MDSEEKVYTGVVDWFATSGQSYGYIRYNLGQIYIHYKQILDSKRDKKFRSLKPGDVVEFNIGTAHYQSGTQAVNLKVVKTKEEVRGQDNLCIKP